MRFEILSAEKINIDNKINKISGMGLSQISILISQYYLYA